MAVDADAAERRFGVGDGTTGTIYTRTGRPFFGDTSPRSGSGPKPPTGGWT